MLTLASQLAAPRIAFPNPTGDDYTRTSFGCLKGPFETGLTNAATGLDQGAGFSLAQVSFVRMRCRSENTR